MFGKSRQVIEQLENKITELEYSKKELATKNKHLLIENEQLNKELTKLKAIYGALLLKS